MNKAQPAQGPAAAVDPTVAVLFTKNLRAHPKDGGTVDLVPLSEALTTAYETDEWTR